MFAGCTGQLRWVDMLVFGPDGTLIWQKRLVLGCDPWSCWGFCDKAMSGFCVEGFLMRFAAAHFGQRNAGSPLNAFMRTVLRFLASRQAPPARRSAFTKRAASGQPHRGCCTRPSGEIAHSQGRLPPSRRCHHPHIGAGV